MLKLEFKALINNYLDNYYDIWDFNVRRKIIQVSTTYVKNDITSNTV